MSNAILGKAKWTLALIFENIWLKLLSLAVAAAIWAMVATEPELSTFATTQVEYKNLPDNVEIDSSPLATVMLELRGPSGALRDIGGPSLRPQVILDMSGSTPGRRTFAIEGGAVKLPPGVRLVRAIPSQVVFDFDRSGAATVPVVVPITGEGHNGYVVASRQTQPSQLDIAGPQSHVARVSQVATDPVDVSNAVGTVEYRVTAYVADPFVQIQSPQPIDVTIVMRKK
jgi:YbbR domain-containing protein